MVHIELITFFMYSMYPQCLCIIYVLRLSTRRNGLIINEARIIVCSSPVILNYLYAEDAI